MVKIVSLFLRLRNSRGSLFAISLLLILVLLVLGTAILVASFSENNAAQRERLTVQAFNVAEAGIEKAIYYLRQDFLSDLSGPSWADGNINGINVSGSYVNGVPPAGFYPLLSGNLNGGTYTVQLKNISGSSRAVWAKSTGVVGGTRQTIEIYARINGVSPWDNAIFAGRGSAVEHKMIKGNVDINGSVHILGTDLQATDYAVLLGGTAELIGNNYAGLSQTLLDKVPALPTITYQGETIKTLNAELRVKHGLVGLDGNSSVGEAQQTGNTIKETVDASYVTDGFAGNQGINNVHSDNGWSNSYDLGDSVTFPSLSDPYGGYATYHEYLRAHALVISDSAKLNVLANITPTTSFSYTDAVNGNGSISMDGNGNLSISGIVYIEGGGLQMNVAGNKKTINYTGTGSIYTSGNVQIDVNFYSAGNSSFPDNIIGFMTPNDIAIGTAANLDVMGLFYAEDKITIPKQTQVMGSIVSNYFDMGSQVPKIFQVPTAANHLPPGLIGQTSSYSMNIVSWQKI